MRELVDAVERYLDGDRDLARRRDLARDHARTAAGHAALALTGGAGAPDARTRALHEVGRAIALDPTNEDAVRTLMRLMTSPPAEMPPEARAALLAETRRSMRQGALVAGIAYLTWFAYLPLHALDGDAQLDGVALLERGVGRCRRVRVRLVALPAARRAASHDALGRRGRRRVVHLHALRTLRGRPGAGRDGSDAPARGPRALAPYPGRRRAAAWRSWCRPPSSSPVSSRRRTSSRTIRSASSLCMLRFPALPTHVFLLVACVALVVTASAIIARFRNTITRIEEKLHVQAWQLQQLVPEQARPASAPRVPESTAELPPSSTPPSSP